MKVLWFSPNPSCYKFKNEQNSSTYGSWTSSLQLELMKQHDVKIGVCFCADGQPQKAEQEGVIYYPVPFHKKTWKNKILDALLIHDITRDKVIWPYYIQSFKNIIEDFQPDVIHVFGAELYIGLATFASDIPLVLHIQGILNPTSEVYFPPGFSQLDYILQDYNPLKIWKRYSNYLWWLRSCFRERTIVQHTKHFIGRTDWDQRATYIMNPHANYHFGEEIMRPLFYNSGLRTLPAKLVINTVISKPYYKGYDLVLKTAYLLKNNLHLDFIWNVYGSVTSYFAEKKLRLYHKDLNIVLHGVVNGNTLRTSHLSSTVYVHTSYIENGCNAIIEAQMCSCPIIANYVGGLVNTVKNGETGYLVPANDPYQTAYFIEYLFTHPDVNMSMGKRAAADALKRHDKEKIVNELISTYRELL